MVNEREQKRGEFEFDTVVSGNLGDYISSFLALSKNSAYTEHVIGSVNKVFGQLCEYTNKVEGDGYVLTGSIARYIAGYGDPQTNWDIRAKVKKIVEEFDVTDQDIDSCMRYTPEGSHSDLYSFIRKRNPDANEEITIEYTNDNIPFTVHWLSADEGNGVTMKIRFGPIKTNLSVSNLVIGFHNEQERVFHIDIGELKEYAADATFDKRQAGLTMDSQNLRIPLKKDFEGRVMYQFDTQKIQGLVEKEHIHFEDRNLSGITEFLVRSLRIHLIHAPELFEHTSIQELTPIFATSELFMIRKILRKFASDGEILQKEALVLMKTELLISMALDPYETAKFIQDTGLYRLIPGLRTMSQSDWKHIFVSHAFMFAQPGKLHTRKANRSLFDIQESHQQFKKEKWGEHIHGIKMFLNAIAEIKGKQIHQNDLLRYNRLLEFIFMSTDVHTENIQYGAISSKLIKNTVSHYSWKTTDDGNLIGTPLNNTINKRLLRQRESVKNYVEVLHKHNPEIDSEFVKALLSVLVENPSGLTEIEIQKELNIKIQMNIDINVFRHVFHAIKSLGCVDKHVRITQDNKQVLFYSPRINQSGNILEGKIYLEKNILKTIFTRMNNTELSDSNFMVLKDKISELSFKTIESFRPLRDWDIEMLAKEMKHSLHNKNDSVSDIEINYFIKQFQQACVSYMRTRGK